MALVERGKHILRGFEIFEGHSPRRTMLGSTREARHAGSREARRHAGVGGRPAARGGPKAGTPPPPRSRWGDRGRAPAPPLAPETRAPEGLRRRPRRLPCCAEATEEPAGRSAARLLSRARCTG